MMEIVIKIFSSLRSPSSFILKSVKGPDLASKIVTQLVSYATSAVLYYKFHTIAFLIKNMVKSPGKCGDTSRT